MNTVIPKRTEVLEDIRTLQKKLMEIGVRGKADGDLEELHSFLSDVQADSKRREHPELDAFYCAACKGSQGHGPYCPWAPHESGKR